MTHYFCSRETLNKELIIDKTPRLGKCGRGRVENAFLITPMEAQEVLQELF